MREIIVIKYCIIESNTKRRRKTFYANRHVDIFAQDVNKFTLFVLTQEEIMTYERILLQTIKFELQVSHPYSYLLKYAKSIKGDKSKIQKLVQMAWTFVNDR